MNSTQYIYESLSKTWCSSKFILVAVKSVTLCMVSYLSQGIILVLDVRKKRKRFDFICTYLYLFINTYFTYKTNMCTSAFTNGKQL